MFDYFCHLPGRKRGSYRERTFYVYVDDKTTRCNLIVWVGSLFTHLTMIIPMFYLDLSGIQVHGLLIFSLLTYLGVLSLITDIKLFKRDTPGISIFIGVSIILLKMIAVWIFIYFISHVVILSFGYSGLIVSQFLGSSENEGLCKYFDPLNALIPDNIKGYFDPLNSLVSKNSTRVTSYWSYYHIAHELHERYPHGNIEICKNPIDMETLLYAIYGDIRTSRDPIYNDIRSGINDHYYKNARNCFELGFASITIFICSCLLLAAMIYYIPNIIKCLKSYSRTSYYQTSDIESANIKMD